MKMGVVLRCADLEVSRRFYETRLGVTFRPERHGAGPAHYSADVGDCLIELYPADARHQAGGTDLLLPETTTPDRAAGPVRDPDGRRILADTLRSRIE